MNFLFACSSFLLFLASIDQARASFMPYTLGHLILRIKCADTIVNTVCAPGGSQDCPKGYRGEENRGACGFATLAHFMNSGNIAGTCCIRDTSLDNSGSTPRPATTSTAATVSSTSKSKFLVYGVPVWAGYSGLPTYGDQSSPYQQGNSALYSIEAVNGSLSAPAGNGAGPYQLGSRTPDFKVTEIRPGNEAGVLMRISIQAAFRRTNAPLQRARSLLKRTGGVQSESDSYVKLKRSATASGALSNRNNNRASEIHITRNENVDIPAERQNLRAYATNVASNVAVQQQASGTTSASSPGSNGPFFYPYPALPQPVYDQSSSGGASGSSGGSSSAYQLVSASSYGQQASTTTAAPYITSTQSQSSYGTNSGSQVNIQIQSSPSNEGLPQPPAYQQAQYSIQKPVRVIENLSTPVRSIDDIQAF